MCDVKVRGPSDPSGRVIHPLQVVMVTKLERQLEPADDPDSVVAVVTVL